MNVAYNRDCMEAMREMPDRSFDLAVVDPIYGDVTTGGYITGKSRGGVGPHPKHHDSAWQQEKTGADFFRELFRVSKNQIIWGGQLLRQGNCPRQSMLDRMGQMPPGRDQICRRGAGLDFL